MSLLSGHRSNRPPLLLRGLAVGLLVVLGGGTALAQDPSTVPPAFGARLVAAEIAGDPTVLSVAATSGSSGGCSDCQQATLGPLVGAPTICASCGCGGCVPGQGPCSPCVARTRIGRFCCGIYEAICCPDPCYDPHWLALADSAFFTEAVRPATQQRFRWDAGLGMVYPDRAEYFWARADGSGLGPKPDAGLSGVRGLDFHELNMYTEAASGKFSFFVNVPYRSVDPDGAPHAAGFGSIDLGTKTLLFDCELLQISFQFKTYLPGGNPFRGLGNGHTSLEPSLLFGLSLSPQTYLQAQVAEWIPLGGNGDYEGAILHYHLSYNRVLWRPLCDVPLIGTMELSGWSFQDGAYSDPVTGRQRASGKTYLSVGPGLRLVICDKVDFGVGTAFALGDHHFAETLVRSEFRWRY